MAPARISGGQTTRSTQARSPRSATTAATPHSAQHDRAGSSDPLHHRRRGYRTPVGGPVLPEEPAGRSSGVDGRPAIGPGLGGLDLGGHPQQHVLAPEGSHELHPDREPVVVPVQRQGDGRLTGDVERRRERHQLGRPEQAVQRVVRRAVEGAQGRRGLGDGRGEEQVEAARSTSRPSGERWPGATPEPRATRPPWRPGRGRPAPRSAAPRPPRSSRCRCGGSSSRGSRRRRRPSW